MKIVSREVWTLGEQVFYTRNAAQNHVDELVYKELKKAMLTRGFTESECFKAAECVLALRARLGELLTCEIDSEDSE
jgi:hypothetical protein